jgi:hypothetical protein
LQTEDGFHDTFHIRIFPVGWNKSPDDFERRGNSHAILPMTSVASAGASLLSAPVELEPNAAPQLRPEAEAQRKL